MTTTELDQADRILDGFEELRGNLIPILQEIQSSFSYLPPEALRRVSRKLRVPLPQIYQVATFYRCFSLEPRGRHLVQVCLGTACHVRGGQRVLERVELEAGVGPSRTSPDLDFTVEPVRCLGCCALAPVVRVDRDTYAHVDQSRVRRLLRRYRSKPADAPAAAVEESSADGEETSHE